MAKLNNDPSAGLNQLGKPMNHTMINFGSNFNNQGGVEYDENQSNGP